MFAQLLSGTANKSSQLHQYQTLKQMRNPKHALPFIGADCTDFFSDGQTISRRSGLYIVTLECYGRHTVVYVGRATNLRSRTQGKHYARVGTSDEGLVNYCARLQNEGRGTVKLFTFPMVNIESWINHREAALIARLKPLYNTKSERQALNPFWAFVDGILESVDWFINTGAPAIGAVVLAVSFYGLIRWLKII